MWVEATVAPGGDETSDEASEITKRCTACGVDKPL
jgi:hypothetical protein